MTRIPQESIWAAENTRQAVNIIPTFVMKATTSWKTVGATQGVYPIWINTFHNNQHIINI